MPFLCRDHDLGNYPMFMDPINDARHVAKFCGAELARCEDKLKTLSEFGMTAWIDDDFGAFFLDVPMTATKLEEYKQVELVVAKMFIDGILWCVSFFSFFFFFFLLLFYLLKSFLTHLFLLYFFFFFFTGVLFIIMDVF